MGRKNAEEGRDEGRVKSFYLLTILIVTVIILWGGGHSIQEATRNGTRF